MTNPNSCSLYIFLIRQLLERRSNKYSVEINREEIKYIFSFKYKIPAYIHWNILKDMENFGLIKIVNKFKIEIIYKDVDDELDLMQQKAETMTQAEIAKEIGVNQQRVSEILRKRKDSGYFG